MYRNVGDGNLFLKKTTVVSKIYPSGPSLIVGQTKDNTGMCRGFLLTQHIFAYLANVYSFWVYIFHLMDLARIVVILYIFGVSLPNGQARRMLSSLQTYSIPIFWVFLYIDFVEEVKNNHIMYNIQTSYFLYVFMWNFGLKATCSTRNRFNISTYRNTLLVNAPNSVFE